MSVGSNGWNYRIVCTYGADMTEPWYGVHEVYYTGDQPTSMTQESVSPCGTELKDFFRAWELYQQAFEKGVLYFDWDANQFTKKPGWIE